MCKTQPSAYGAAFLYHSKLSEPIRATERVPVETIELWKQMLTLASHSVDLFCSGRFELVTRPLSFVRWEQMHAESKSTDAHYGSLKLTRSLLCSQIKQHQQQCIVWSCASTRGKNSVDLILKGERLDQTIKQTH